MRLACRRRSDEPARPSNVQFQARGSIPLGERAWRRGGNRRATRPGRADRRRGRARAGPTASTPTRSSEKFWRPSFSRRSPATRASCSRAPCGRSPRCAPSVTRRRCGDGRVGRRGARGVPACTRRPHLRREALDRRKEEAPMPGSHSKWKDHENTRYPSVGPPGPAGGGGSGDREPLEREIRDADREFAELNRKAARKRPGRQRTSPTRRSGHGSASRSSSARRRCARGSRRWPLAGTGAGRTGRDACSRASMPSSRPSTTTQPTQHSPAQALAMDTTNRRSERSHELTPEERSRGGRERAARIQSAKLAAMAEGRPYKPAKRRRRPKRPWEEMYAAAIGSSSRPPCGSRPRPSQFILDRSGRWVPACLDVTTKRSRCRKSAAVQGRPVGHVPRAQVRRPDRPLGPAGAARIGSRKASAGTQPWASSRSVQPHLRRVRMLASATGPQSASPPRPSTPPRSPAPPAQLIRARLLDLLAQPARHAIVYSTAVLLLAVFDRTSRG